MIAGASLGRRGPGRAVVAAERRRGLEVAVAAVGLVAGGVVLSAAVASGHPILAARWSLLWLLALWSALWVGAVVLVFRLPARLAIGVIVVGAVALRLAALAGPPVTSDDLYRYSWDGRVQAAGIDPYAQPPGSPALAGLRDPWLWPDPAGCAALHRPDGCTRVNRPTARTIYPPVAETWFAAVSRVSGPGARHKAWQVAGLVTDLAAVGLLLAALGRWGRDRRWAALYALSPAPVLEVVNNGHVDGLAIVFLLGALIALAPRPAGPRSGLAGALIGAAALVKLYPAVALVAVVGATRTRRWGPLVRAAGAAIALTGVAYLPHVRAVGTKVLGYLPGYLREEHYQQGGRFLIAAALHLPTHVRGPASVAALAAVAAWVLVRRPPVPAAVALLFGTLLLAVSPVQPWYAVGLLAAATLAAEPAWVAVILAGYPYFFAVILASPHAALIGELSYGAASACVLVMGNVAWMVGLACVPRASGAPGRRPGRSRRGR